MKKIIFFLLLLFYIPVSILAINGNGTYASPYNGPLTSDMNWSGTVYVNGDITVNGFTLTISPGTKVVFVASGANIIITGTGVLAASGGPGASMIRFTADFNNNGIYGEPGETWGHISFQNMTTTTFSTINYCIIEFGQKGSGDFGTETAGGGIYTDYTYLTISNSIIRNNYAGYGGGILVTQCSPNITNCSICNNSAATTGGGILFYINCPSVVENCVIYNNISSGPGGAGGVFAGFEVGNLLFYNCVIASNISTWNYGDNIRLYSNTNSPYPEFQNCIIWGSDNWIQYIGSPLNATNFTNCALQGGASSYINCFNINSNNTGTSPDGPNFNNPSGGDYSIAFISPCHDMGLSTNAPATDYLGNPRIGPFDIGAYEVQYSRWTGASDNSWTNSLNWEQNIDPSTGTGDVIIPAGLFNYPDEGTVSIGTGNYLIIDPDAQAIFGTLNNSGTLWLKSDSYGVADSIASLIVGQYNQDGGNEKIELYLTGGGTKTTYKWHYISSPVSSLAVSTFAPAHTLDLAAWYDNRVTGSLATGWVAYDGYVYSTGVSNGPTFSTLSPGTGYDYYSGTDQKYTFSGLLNTSDVTVELSYSSDDNLHGFNLLGNPFSSGLNWDDVANETYYAYPPSTSKSLYFTRDNVQCSYINGVGIPSDVTGVIPPMQGFFNKTYSAGNTITFSSDARIQTGIHPRYKKLSVIPLVRLSLAEGKLSDETVVRFDNSAETGLDNNFDALKLFLSSDNVSIYSSSAGVNYSINGQPFPDTFVQIPVVVNLTKDTLHTITATQLQGLDKYDVTLTDNTTGFIADLKTTPVLTFSDGPGTITGRFILTIGTASIVTGTETPLASNNTFNIYPANSFINIQTISDEWDGKSGTVEVIDLTGNTVKEVQNAEFSKNSLVQVPVAGFKGLYMVEIRSGIMKYVGKVVIR